VDGNDSFLIIACFDDEESALYGLLLFEFEELGNDDGNPLFLEIPVSTVSLRVSSSSPANK